jgi:hypothetical protein
MSCREELIVDEAEFVLNYLSNHDGDQISNQDISRRLIPTWTIEVGLIETHLSLIGHFISEP